MKKSVLTLLLIALALPVGAVDDEVVTVKKSQLVQVLNDNAKMRRQLMEAKQLLDRGATALGTCSKEIAELRARSKRDSCA